VAERAAVVCLQSDVYFALQQPDRGLEEAAECLRQAGLDIPLRPTPEQARAAYSRILSKLDGVGIEEIAALPLMSDPTSRAILDVLAKIAPTAAVVGDNFQILIASNAVDVTLQRGIHDGSCFAFVWLGFVAGWLYGSFDASFRFGQGRGPVAVEMRNGAFFRSVGIGSNPQPAAGLGGHRRNAPWQSISGWRGGRMRVDRARSAS
jgi:hypothetical protein